MGNATPDIAALLLKGKTEFRGAAAGKLTQEGIANIIYGNIRRLNKQCRESDSVNSAYTFAIKETVTLAQILLGTSPNKLMQTNIKEAFKKLTSHLKSDQSPRIFIEGCENSQIAEVIDNWMTYAWQQIEL